MPEPKTFDHLLLGVGAMKAGTTWIFDALHRHPEIYFCREKEIHFLYAQHVDAAILSDTARMRRAKDYLYFDPERSAIPVLQKRVEWTANWLKGPVNDAWFNGLFLHRGAAKWVAEFSNLGALVPEQGWAKLHARTRKLRILYTLRDPMDRLWSHVRFHHKMHNASDKLDAMDLHELEHHIRHGLDYMEHSDYVGAITRMQAALPPECLHIGFLDQIRAEPSAFIADVERFLEIGHNDDLPEAIIHRVVNPSPPRPMPEGLQERFAGDVARQIDGLTRLGISVPESWRSA